MFVPQLFYLADPLLVGARDQLDRPLSGHRLEGDVLHARHGSRCSTTRRVAKLARGTLGPSALLGQLLLLRQQLGVLLLKLLVLTEEFVRVAGERLFEFGHCLPLEKP